MNRSQQAAPNPEGIVQHFRERCGAVCGAAGVADDGAGCRDHMIVNPGYQSRVEGILAGHGQDHASRAGIDVLLQIHKMPEGT